MNHELALPTSKKIALVTGGSGFVGGALIGELLAAGWSVRALARSGPSEAAVRARGAEPARGELNDEASLRAAMHGCDVVFHGAAHFRLWGERAAFDRANVDGMKTLVDAAKASPSVRRVIGISAAAVVMGDPEPMLDVSEDLPLQSRAFAPYSSSKAQGERILLAANGARPDFETVALRPPFIWGPTMPALEEMIHTVRAGRWRWVDGGDQVLSTCHVDNLCAALVLAAEKGRGGQAYFVADNEQSTLKSFLSELFATRLMTADDRSVPFGVAWTMAGVMGAVWQSFGLKGQPPITRQMLRLIGKPFTVDTAKARAELGYTPQISRMEGLAAMRLTGSPGHSSSSI